MRKLKMGIVVSFLLLPLLALVPACGGNNNNGGGTGGGSFGPPATVDVIASDTNRDIVVLFLDLLNFVPTATELFPQPDVTLDSGTFSHPRSLIFAGSDIVVCDVDNGEVYIFEDYTTLTDASTPDVTLSNAGGFDEPQECVYDETEDTLIIRDGNYDGGGNEEVYLYRAYSAIAADGAPDVTLDGAGGSLISYPDGITVADGDLWVGNTDLVLGGPCVTGYRDISTLTDGDAPDVRLDNDTSFGLADTDIDCGKLAVFNDDLFVSTRSDAVFIFEGASTLASDALPDTVLFNTLGGLDTPMNPLGYTNATGANTLFVPNRNCEDHSAAIFGWNVPQGGMGSLPDAAPADIVLGGREGSPLTGRVQNLSIAGGALFFMTADGSCDSDTTGLGFYQNVDGLTTGQWPDQIIPGGDEGNIAAPFTHVVSLDALVRP